MSPRIKDTSKSLPRVRDTGRHGDRIEPDVIAEALGAEATTAELSIRTSPPSLLAVRQELAQRLISKGGRKSLKGATRRQKIPLQDEDWERLQELAKHIEDPDVHPTAGQLASVLLNQVLRNINVSDFKRMGEHE